MLRRSFLKLVSGIPAGRISRPDGEGGLEVGVSVSERGMARAGPGPISEAAKAIGKTLRSALPDCDVRVRYAGTVETPDELPTAESALEWWRDHDDAEHDVELLVLSHREEWIAGGHADGTAHAVCFGAEYMTRTKLQALALHEIGHVLGIDHDDAEVREDGDRTVSTPMAYGLPGESELEFSPAAKRKLRRSVG